MSAEQRGLRDARRHRRALVSALLHWNGSSDDDPDPVSDDRRRLRGAELRTGEGRGAILDLYDDSRATQWRLDLQREAQRIAGCEAARVLLCAPDGAFRPMTCGCKSRLCPVCARPRAARAVARWLPVLEAAAADGAELRHTTLTQPAIVGDGGLVTPIEARRYGWRGTVAADGVVARAVGGEGLGESYVRLRDALTEVRKNGSTREAWRATLGGYVLGCEWTGRSPEGVPRWHVHVHLLTVTPQAIPQRLVDRRLAEWARHVGGSPKAQHSRVCAPDKLTEVLKYPFKISNLTSAQRIEVLAYMRGMHPHQAAGSWHASSRDHCRPPWAGWLAARPDPPRYRRVHYIPRRRDPEGRDVPGEPEVYRGTPDRGEETFALPSTAGRWETWRADAAVYAAMLRGEPDGPELEGDDGDLLDGAA